ncbi:MAG TPA: inositol monophosphatase [Bacteroidetes bacterium]|nr:inositol monophosphatase [Bacteroidota bacterium]
MALEKLCSEACVLVKEVGLFIRNEKGKVLNKQIEEKELNSLVSYVDKTAEKKLVKGLSQLLSGSTFLTEEETIEQTSGKYRWIIDPLDGTTNFLHQVPYYAVSVALEENGKICLGIVYEINNDECFYAWEKGGAFLNDRPIKVTTATHLKDTLIATGFPYRDYTREEAYFNVFKYFMKNTRGIRRCGAAAVDLVYVACGRFDAFFEYGLNAWDVAAGAFIVQEAGGKVYDFKGGRNYLFGSEMIAVNDTLSKNVLKIISEIFKA